MLQVKLCLKCNGKFKSTGPGNRLCSRCNNANATISKRLQSSGHLSADADDRTLIASLSNAIASAPTKPVTGDARKPKKAVRRTARGSIHDRS